MKKYKYKSKSKQLISSFKLIQITSCTILKTTWDCKSQANSKSPMNRTNKIFKVEYVFLYFENVFK